MSEHGGRREAIVIGAGPAGLGAAGQLRRRGVDVLVLERADAVASSWRGRYEGLRLNSVRWMSGVPGARIPRRAGRWPARTEYVSYLERYAAELDIRFGVEVERVDRDGDGYLLDTSCGPLHARYVVVATGYDREPVVPEWPGREGFEGDLIHSSRYRSPDPFCGKDVLVVGSGNTGTEVSAQLAAGGASRVRIAVRTGVNIFTREPFGVPITALGWMSSFQPAWLADRTAALLRRLTGADLSAYGMPRPPYGVATELREKGLGPVVDNGFIAAVKAGVVEIVPTVERFEGTEVVLADGRRLRPDAVIAATGYRHGLERLVGSLGVLTPAGKPQMVGKAHPSAPGVYFNGYHLPLYGQLTAMRRTSRSIGRSAARDRRARRHQCARRPRVVERMA